jgi:hypothetical protein
MYSIVLEIETCMVHSYASSEKIYEGDTLRFECMVCVCSDDRGCSDDRSDTVSLSLVVNFYRGVSPGSCKPEKMILFSTTQRDIGNSPTL